MFELKSIVSLKYFLCYSFSFHLSLSFLFLFFLFLEFFLFLLFEQFSIVWILLTSSRGCHFICSFPLCISWKLIIRSGRLYHSVFVFCNIKQETRHAEQSILSPPILFAFSGSSRMSELHGLSRIFLIGCFHKITSCTRDWFFSGSLQCTCLCLWFFFTTFHVYPSGIFIPF